MHVYLIRTLSVANRPIRLFLVLLKSLSRLESKMNLSATRDYHGDGRFIQRFLVRQNISKLTFRPIDDVLDVGCGTGEETKSIAATVRSVTGIEPRRVKRYGKFPAGCK